MRGFLTWRTATVAIGRYFNTPDHVAGLSMRLRAGVRTPWGWNQHLIICGISSSSPTTTSAPVAPVLQTVAPVAVPVAPKHVVKKRKRKHTVHRAPGTATKTNGAPVPV